MKVWKSALSIPLCLLATRYDGPMPNCLEWFNSCHCSVLHFAPCALYSHQYTLHVARSTRRQWNCVTGAGDAKTDGDELYSSKNSVLWSDKWIIGPVLMVASLVQLTGNWKVISQALKSRPKGHMHSAEWTFSHLWVGIVLIFSLPGLCGTLGVWTVVISEDSAHWSRQCLFHSCFLRPC